MKRTFSPLTCGLIGALALAGAALAGPLPAGASADGGRPMTATTVSTTASRIFCYNGVKGTPSDMSRGWVCQREAAPTRH